MPDSYTHDDDFDQEDQEDTRLDDLIGLDPDDFPEESDDDLDFDSFDGHNDWDEEYPDEF
jgi:hypothetical protein